MTQVSCLGLSSSLPDGTPLFSNISVSLHSKSRVGVVGKNGAGKSTLLKCIHKNILLAKESQAEQQHSQFVDFSQDSPFWFPDEENCLEAFKYASLLSLEVEKLYLPESELSSGQRVKKKLVQVFSQNVDFLLLDEPDCFLDEESQQTLLKCIESFQGGVIIVSHSRKILNSMQEIWELESGKLNTYGGNFDFYFEQREKLSSSLLESYESSKNDLNRTRKIQQQQINTKRQKDANGNKAVKSGKTNQSKIYLKALKEASQKTFKTIKRVHKQRLNDAESKVTQAKDRLFETIDVSFMEEVNRLQKQKSVLTCQEEIYSYPDSQEGFIYNLSIVGPERVAIQGCNGSGKSTFLKMISEEQGLFNKKRNKFIHLSSWSYLSQDLLSEDSSISSLTTVELVHSWESTFPEFIIRQRLGALGLYGSDSLKKISEMSSGQRVKAILCALMCSKYPPELLILDEPTQFLDLATTQELEVFLQKYGGALLVVSHDSHFLKSINIERYLTMKEGRLEEESYGL